MRNLARALRIAGVVALGLSAGGAMAQEPMYERIGNWTVVQGPEFCTAPGGEPTAFPDGTMPPWSAVSLYMADPLTMEVRYSGDIAADAPLGLQEAQVLLMTAEGKTDYFRPKLIVAEQPGGGRQATAILDGEVLEALKGYDYFLLRAGSQMLPLALTPHRDDLLDAMQRCVERL